MSCREDLEDVEKLPCTQCWPSNEPGIGRYRSVKNPIRGLDRSVTDVFNRLTLALGRGVNTEGVAQSTFLRV